MHRHYLSYKTYCILLRLSHKIKISHIDYPLKIMFISQIPSTSQDVSLGALRRSGGSRGSSVGPRLFWDHKEWPI